MNMLTWTRVCHKVSTFQNLPFLIRGLLPDTLFLRLGFVASSSMASPSCIKICLHCDHSSSDSLTIGWDLSTGKFAQLCDPYTCSLTKLSPKSEIVPMFEKILHAGGIAISHKHAEAYLPEVSDPDGIPLYVIDDTAIKEWNLRLLTFSRLIPDGPYVIGSRKASTKKPSRKLELQL
ncbi:hypothetical protein L1987_55627 [Smallanthus sonchifolius]|uniref:Uncharacterized protein n=1 Tax=Smallanthus sonchifolius TaxID=185202 RepID=A0ACB9EAF3_9ASTR|nr:hypothetical protein L1987_55627 [Smallanthus sonchifolius]